MRSHLARFFVLLALCPAVGVAQPGPAERDRLLAAARAANEALEYEAVISPAEAALEHPLLTAEQRVELYLLLGSALSIVRDPAAAERPFRLLLRFRPDFELPAGSPPKIQAAFRRVQVEEKAIQAELTAQRRASLISELELHGAPPDEGRGGQPLGFSFRLRDPRAVVERFSVPYRRAGEPAYSVLALRRGEDGVWTGALGGEQTASDDGFTLEYYLETADRDGPLLQRGSAQAPLTARLSAGQVSAGPKVPKLVFWSGVGAAATFGLCAGVLGLQARGAQAEYSALLESARQREVDGLLINRRRDEGVAFSTAANVTAIAALSFAVASAVVGPMVQW